MNGVETVDNYNRETCSPVHWTDYLCFNQGPMPGAVAPDFDLPTITGDWFRLSDHRGERPVLFEFTSITSPIAAATRSSVRMLYSEFGDEVWFVSIYAREANPGKRYPRPASFAEKMQHADQWAERDRITWTVAVDWLEGRTHQAYGGLPNLTYLIDRTGHVAFRSFWSGQRKLLRRILRKLLRLQSKASGVIDLGESRSFMAPLLLGTSAGPRSKRFLHTLGGLCCRLWA